MNPEGLYKKKDSGKDELSVKDMSAVSGMDESYIRKAKKHGFLNPPHYTAKYAIDGVKISDTDENRVQEHERVLADKTKGKYTPDRIRDVAVSRLVDEKKKEGQPIFFKYKEKSAEQVFDQFWKSPAGKQRMTGKLKKEIDNIDRGGSWYDNPGNLHAMPDNFDAVLWETTKQEAARFHVLAQTGDKEAAEKYNKIRNGLADPSLLPKLESEPEKKK